MSQVGQGAYLDGRSGLNPADFITPEDPAITALAQEIRSKLGEQDSLTARLREAYNYVTANVKYVVDMKAFGYEEVWQKPTSTLKRGVGDCEDLSFLLCSLLLALGVQARVVFGGYNGEGHAWVEAGAGDVGGILETTTGQPFSGFADPKGYSTEETATLVADPTMAFIVYVSPGLALFGVGAFLMLDDAHDAFKMELSTSTTEGEPGKHGILAGVTIPGLGPHLHHWWIGLLLVMLSIVILAVGVVMWMLKYL